MLKLLNLQIVDAGLEFTCQYRAGRFNTAGLLYKVLFQSISYGGQVMVANIIVGGAFAAVLVAKWRFFSKYYAK